MDNSQKYITISVAAFICYCNTLGGTFVFDDNEAIVKNKDVMPYTNIWNIFKNDFWGTDITLNSSHKSYRPLTILSYRLNVLYSKDKLDAFQFHATNIILYGLLCLLSVPVFELFLKKSKYATNVHDIAFLSGLLFTVHPVHTEAVAGLVGRADILSSVLFFVIILLYQKVRNSTGECTVFWFTVVVVLTGCAVLCKETSITVVGVLIVYDIYRVKRKSISWMEMLKFWLIVRCSLVLIAGLCIMYYRLEVMNFEGPLFTDMDNPAAYAQNVFTRVMYQFIYQIIFVQLKFISRFNNLSFFLKVFTYNYIYLLNFLLMLWPQWLCFDWSMGCIPLIENICDIRVIFVVLFWMILIFGMFSLLKQNYENEILDARIMAVCIIVLPFFPASNIFFTVGFVIAERTLLLPSAGFCLLVVIGYKKLFRKTQNNKICSCFFYGLLIIFVLRTILRNMNWLTEEKLFSSALDVCPLNAKVHYNIAKIAADNNNKAVALEEYRKAIQLNPKYEQAMNNLANLLREDKKFEEAEVLLRKAVDVRPNFAAAWMNLGIVLTNLNRSDESEHCYKMAIKYRNKYPDCYYNLGNLYLDLKRNENALKAWEMAVLYKPNHVAAWSNTLVLLDSMKKYDEVIELGRTALIHNPKAPALHFSYANTLGKLQQFEKAEGHFLEAINLNPTNGLYYSNLGVLYHRWGKKDKARQMYTKALQIDPNLKSAELNLKRLTKEAQ
ncbi:protein O-mannosyl-transferase TMTC4-like isoform X1 [Diorhabda carinulata]|uniref:protein O-mannosyl-transferase TMTC4-like isoform X1 n=1 Tax=Diorhabda carinulata TaxID=1163345 RepID=UPI0025A20D78|nr:protein O-mannosyl-transferase TMTC4-like isoform X1 [Diorhabda carinulata]